MIGKNEFETVIDNSNLNAFVQNNSDFYKRKWTEIYEKTRSVEKVKYGPSWNWAAFFLTGGWLFYRKLYVWGCAYWVAIAVWIFAEEFFGDFPKGVNTGITIALALVISRFANAVYFQHVRENLQALDKVAGDAAAVQKIIHRHGGTSWLAAIIGTLVPLIAIFVATFVAQLIADGPAG